MRGIAVASLCALAIGCTSIHEASDGSPSNDAGAMTTDAFVAPTDASSLSPDAGQSPHDGALDDAWIASSDVWIASNDAWVAPTDAWVASSDAGAGAPDASGPTHSGLVAFEQSSTSSSPFLAAYFLAVSPADQMRGIYAPSCTVLEEAPPCRFVSCASGYTTDLAGTLSASHAGTPILSTSAPMTLPGPPTTSLYVAMGGTPLAVGDLVTLAASGATVPAFSQTLAMPPSALPTLPSTVSHGASYAVTWPATAADQIWLGIDASSAAAPGYVQCVAPASAASITVPPTMLARFPVGQTVYPYAANVNVAYVTAGDYVVQVFVWQFTESSAAVQP